MKKVFKVLVVFFVCVAFLSNFSYLTFGEDLKTPSGISINNLENEIDNFMGKHIGKSAPGASIAVVKDGKIVFSKGYGYMDLENKIPVTKDTVFEYGSISKLFVWTSAMKLVEDGKLDLDKDIREYLPEDFNKKLKLKHGVTMRNIMNHSSGFGEYPFDLILDSEPKDDFSLENAILNAHPKQYYKPGEGSAYSNYATALGALVVEKITGKKFYEFEKENIFQNASMNNTAGNINWSDNKEILKNKSKGYLKIKEGFKDNGWPYVPLYPAGSVNGTSEDLAKFAMDIMSTNPKILKKDTIDFMLKNSYKDNETGTSHGFFQYDSKEGNAFGHGGNTKAFSSQFSFNTDENFALVILTNAAGEMDITMGLQNLLMGNSMDKISALDTKNEFNNNASQFNGTYVTMRRCENTPLEFINYLQLGSF